jgi:hypothetical protein
MEKRGHFFGRKNVGAAAANPWKELRSPSSLDLGNRTRRTAPGFLFPGNG